ncbi:MAG TPA: glycine cleavage T C-terminal barrel domain-containing protein, partial [Thermoleophilia bacterium]|nr:glycine cleavage T C-terminal barrel domain-containing protein [Thermoleophilia bacterium]
LYVSPFHAVQVWDRLWAAGRDDGVVAGGYRVLDSLRAEKGYRYMGTDLTAGDTPYAAGLGFCVGRDKPDFIGREALAAPGATEPAMRLRTIVVGEGEQLPLYGGEAVRIDGAVRTRVRSCAYGYTVGRTIAFAYLPAGLAVGDPVEVEVLGRPHPATVAERVLHDPQNLRVLA